MPVLINDKDCRTFVVDGDCAYELKPRDTTIFIDFEFVYALMPDDLKRVLGPGEHCDAIRVSISGDKLVVELIELSMNQQRELAEYYRKLKYCLKFVDFLIGNIKKEKRNEKGIKVRANRGDLEVKGLEVKAFIVVNPAVVNKVQRGIDEMDPAWFFRELYNIYPVKARARPCVTPPPT